MALPWAGMALACAMALAAHRQKSTAKPPIFLQLERALKENWAPSRPILLGGWWKLRVCSCFSWRRAVVVSSVVILCSSLHKQSVEEVQFNWETLPGHGRLFLIADSAKYMAPHRRCDSSILRLLSLRRNRSRNARGAGIGDEQHGGLVSRLSPMYVVHRLADGLPLMND